MQQSTQTAEASVRIGHRLVRASIVEVSGVGRVVGVHVMQVRGKFGHIWICCSSVQRITYYRNRRLR
jgi:hypothetical protein